MAIAVAIPVASQAEQSGTRTFCGDMARVARLELPQGARHLDAAERRRARHLGNALLNAIESAPRAVGADLLVVGHADESAARGSAVLATVTAAQLAQDGNQLIAYTTATCRIQLAA